MGKRQEVHNLQQLLDRLGDAAETGEQVSVGAVLNEVGRRSFGPFLLVAGIITLAPIIGDIPGVPTIVAALVFLISIQLVFCRNHFWLPNWLLNRSMGRSKLRQAIRWLRPVARFTDRLLRPRLTMFTHQVGIYAVALVCLAIALAMPAMELIPFSANGAGAALTAFGLSLVAHDGLLALIAFGLTVATFGAIAYGVL